MLRHLNDIPRMGDDEGVLRLRMLTAAHHGTMPSSLPHSLDSVPGATIDRWIRLAEHLNHLGAEQGATDGWTPGDVVTYFGQGPGVLLTVGVPILHMRTLDIQPDFTEFGVVDVPLENSDHIELVDRNPYSHVGWDTLPDGMVIDNSGRQQVVAAGIAAGVDVGTIHLDTVGTPALPPSGGIWIPPPGYHSERRAQLTSWVSIDQDELNILVWSFLVVNHMTMTQVLAFIDGLGPFSPNQVIRAFQAARERRARETLLPARNVPDTSHTLIHAVRGAEAPFPQTIPRRRLVAHGLTSRQFPMRQWVQLRILSDFTDARVPEDLESDEKSKEGDPIKAQPPIYSAETLALIARETLTKTPLEAAQNSFKYLEDIIRQAPDVTPDGPDRAFSYNWRGKWSDWLGGFDKSVHVLTQLAKLYTESGNEKQNSIDAYIEAFIQDSATGVVGGDEMIHFFKDKKEWFNWRGADNNAWGGEREWRLAAFKMLNETGGEEYDVLNWFNYEDRPGGLLWDFVLIVTDALNDNGYKRETDAILRSERQEIVIGEEEQERISWEKKHAPKAGRAGGEAITFILVAVLAVLAFLLMSR